jgi:hypothetical protein
VIAVAMAHHVALVNDVPKGGIVRWDDVIIDDSLATAITLRRETEALAASVASER